MFKGATVAIVTPFKDGAVDYETLRSLVEFQIKHGTNAILPCGTTGESPTLDHDEHAKVIETCIDAAADRVPILAGTGSNSTKEAIDLTAHAAKAGASGALVVTPYYNKPTQKGLYRHFKAVADSVQIPIILYNIAGRTATNIETDTVAKLASDCKNIIGVKEASGSLDQAQSVRLSCGKDFLILSGDDALTLPILGIGGSGVVSVLSNIIPGDIVNVINTFNEGKIDEARELHYKILPLAKAMFVESNPQPVKKAMEFLGLCGGETRLPLCEMDDKNIASVKKALEAYGILNVNA